MKKLVAKQIHKHLLHTECKIIVFIHDDVVLFAVAQSYCLHHDPTMIWNGKKMVEVWRLWLQHSLAEEIWLFEPSWPCQNFENHAVPRKDERIRQTSWCRHRYSHSNNVCVCSCYIYFLCFLPMKSSIYLINLNFKFIKKYLIIN